MKRRMIRALCAAALTVCMTAAAVTCVQAATPDYLIDTSQTASLTITKYDQTAATTAGVDISGYTATGEQNTTAETALASYALAGVEFTYLKVADYTDDSGSDISINVTGEGGIVLKYDLPAALDTILGFSTENRDADAQTIDGINDALSTLLATTAGKNTLETYATANGGTPMTETDASGVTSASGLSLGLYLVVETKVPENVNTTTDPFFVALPMTTADGSAWNYDVYVYPKNQTNNPTLNKLVKSDDTNAAYGDTATVSAGETVSYRIVTKLPIITSGTTYLTKYEFADTLDEGLTYNTGDGVKIELYPPVDATWEQTSQETYIESVRQGTATAAVTWSSADTTSYFTTSYGTSGDESTMTIVVIDADLAATNTGYEDGLAVINESLSDGYLVVSYTAAVNTDSAITLGDAGMDNNVQLTYSRSNTAYTETIGDKARVYSYGIKLTKVFSGDSAGDYSKVKFILQNAADSSVYLTATGSGGVYYITGSTSEKSKATEFIPASGGDNKGTLVICGLEADTYHMTETETDEANGYCTLDSCIEIVINESSVTITPSAATVTGITDNNTAVTVGITTSASATAGGTETGMNADGDSDNAYVTFSVTNAISQKLPGTGGSGILIYTAGGMMLFLLAAMLLRKSGRSA